MPRLDATQRRREIAAMLKRGKSLAEVSQHFDVSERLVRSAAKEFHVPLPKSKRKPTRQAALVEQIAADLRVGVPPDRVAEKHKLSGARMKQVQQKIVDRAVGKRKK